MNWWIPVLVIGWGVVFWAGWTLIRVAALTDDDMEGGF